MEPERTLTDAQRDEFEDMLRALTLERSQIKEAMGFALDNADAAGEVLLISWYLNALCICDTGTMNGIISAFFSLYDVVS